MYAPDHIKTQSTIRYLQFEMRSKMNDKDSHSQVKKKNLCFKDV